MQKRDVIYRQAAIDAVADLYWMDERLLNFKKEIDATFDKIKALPSAQPYPEEFEWCYDCKEYDQDSHCCHRWTKVIRQTVEEFKKAQTERKKGRWIRITQGADPELYMCPFCHRTVESYSVEELLSIRYPYCHCGADMRGEQE